MDVLLVILSILGFASCGRLDNAYLPPTLKISPQNIGTNNNLNTHQDTSSSLNNDVPHKYSAPSGYTAGNSAPTLESSSIQNPQYALSSGPRPSLNAQYGGPSFTQNQKDSYQPAASNQRFESNKNRPSALYGTAFSGSPPDSRPSIINQDGGPRFTQNQKDYSYQPAASNQLLESNRNSRPSAQYGTPSSGSTRDSRPSINPQFGGSSSAQNQRDAYQPAASTQRFEGNNNRPSTQYGTPLSGSTQNYGTPDSRSSINTQYGESPFASNQKDSYQISGQRLGHDNKPSTQYGSTQKVGAPGGQTPSRPNAYASDQQRFNDITDAPSSFSGQVVGSPSKTNSLNQVPILRLENTNYGDGTYQYAYETADGIRAEEQGDGRGEGTQARGGFSYTSPEGQQLDVTYVADENGYQPQGAHLPTPPPVPQAILRSLELNRAEEAKNPNSRRTGYSNDGDGTRQSYYNEESRVSENYKPRNGFSNNNLEQNASNGYQYNPPQASNFGGVSGYQNKPQVLQNNGFADGARTPQRQSLGYNNGLGLEQFRAQPSEINQNRVPGQQTLDANGGYKY